MHACMHAYYIHPFIHPFVHKFTKTHTQMTHHYLYILNLDWGVHVDCFLSLWMPPETRLNEEVRERVSEYVDHIYEEGIAYDR